jgi:hypothetical protein
VEAADERGSAQRLSYARVVRRNAAEELNQITIDCTVAMGRALRLVRTAGSHNETAPYLRDIAEVLAAITLLAGRIYREYPDLTPPQLTNQERKQ